MTPPLDQTPLATLLNNIGSKSPAPGGGAAAAITGAMAAALAQMVVAFSLGKKSLAAHEDDLRRADETLRHTRDLFLRLAEEDAAAYEGLNTLFKLPQDDPRRAAEFPAAVERALQPPRATLAAATNLLRLIDRLTGITNRQLRSDLAIAAVLADAAAHASDWNIRINLPLIDSEPKRDGYRSESSAGLDDAAALRAKIETACSA